MTQPNVRRITMMRLLAPWLLAVVLSACGSPTSPRSPLDKNATVTVRVFNSSSGEIVAARLTLRVQQGTSTTVRLSDLPKGDFDPLRAVLYPASGGTLGRFVTKTTTGLLTLPEVSADAAYDLFLMNTAAGADYASIDDMPLTPVSVPRYSSIRIVHGGEEVLGTSTVDFPSTAFSFATEQFNLALNPFGVQFGRLDVKVGNDADITAGWMNAPDCTYSKSGPGVFLLNWMYVDTSGINHCTSYRHAPRIFGGALVNELLASAYFGTPPATKCLLVACPNDTGPAYTNPTWPLSERGKDAVRYWALMNPR